MIKVMWLNLKYLTNKKVFLILGISLLLLVLYLTINTNFMDKKESKIMFRYEYYYLYKTTSFNFIQNIFCFLAIFLSMMTYKNYDLYFITRTNRKTAILGRYLSVYFLLGITLVPIYSLFILLPNIFMTFFQIKWYYIDNFIIIYIVALILSSITLLIMEILNNSFSGFLVIFLFWIMKLIYGNNVNNSFVYYLFPLPLVKEGNDKLFFANGNLACFILFFLINTIAVFYYCEKSIKK